MAVSTLRKIEAGTTPEPAFFRIVALCGAVGLDVNDVVARVDAASE